MATWMAHFRIAENLLSYLPEIDREAFLVGSIGPDCGEPNADWTDFSPPSSITHWTPGGRKLHCNYEAFYDAYLAKPQPRDKFSFYLAYCLHLISDVLWTKNAALPNAKKFQRRFDTEDGFIWKVKRDWYDQDHLFLKENPGFPAFHMFANIRNFKNKYLDYYSDDAFEKQIAYITAFYKKSSDSLNREFPYLTKDEMDLFVESTTNELLKTLKEKEIL